MTFTRDGDSVTLQMSVEDWENLLILTGIALGAIKRTGDDHRFYLWRRFNNEMNRTNPQFTQYEIPEAV